MATHDIGKETKKDYKKEKKMKKKIGPPNCPEKSKVYK
jgi:hypothetical protein